MTDLSLIEELDITGEVCPMTFVRTRLALDRIAPGSILRVHLRGPEPLRNVSANSVALGHEVLETRALGDGSTLVEIRRR